MEGPKNGLVPRNIACIITVVAEPAAAAEPVANANVAPVSEAQAEVGADPSSGDAANLNNPPPSAGGESVSNTCSADANVSNVSEITEKLESAAVSAVVAGVMGDAAERNVANVSEITEKLESAAVSAVGAGVTDAGVEKNQGMMANVNEITEKLESAAVSVTDGSVTDAGVEQNQGMVTNVNEITEKLESCGESAAGDGPAVGQLPENTIVTKLAPAIDSKIDNDQLGEISEFANGSMASVVDSRAEFESAQPSNNGGIEVETAELINLEIAEEAEEDGGERNPDTSKEILVFEDNTSKDLSTFEDVNAPKEPLAFEDIKEILDDAVDHAVTDSAADKSNNSKEEERKSRVVEPTPSHSRFQYTTDPKTAPEANIFDSHCHLDRVIHRKDRVDPNAFERFIKNNYKNFGPKFEGCITVFCDPADWDLNDDRLNFIGDPRIWVTFGCHPRFAPNFGPKEEDKLRQMLKATMSKVAALGEIGLDGVHANRGTSPMDVQKRVFLKQIAIALEMRLPLCIHIREANKIGMEVMKESGLPRDWPIHMHCFSDGWDVCEKWMSDWPKMKFGFTPDYYQRDVVIKIPLDRLLCETDAPYFVPLVEGKRKGSMDSHPGYVFHSAAQIAARRKITVSQVLEASRRNVREVYGM